jgi:hypothetical protein
MESLAIPIEKVRSFTREDFNRMRDQGILPRHTELLAGVLVDKVAISPKHAYTFLDSEIGSVSIFQLTFAFDKKIPLALAIPNQSPISVLC